MLSHLELKTRGLITDTDTKPIIHKGALAWKGTSHTKPIIHKGALALRGTSPLNTQVSHVTLWHSVIFSEFFLINVISCVHITSNNPGSPYALRFDYPHFSFYTSITSRFYPLFISKNKEAGGWILVLLSVYNYSRGNCAGPTYPTRACTEALRKADLTS